MNKPSDNFIAEMLLKTLGGASGDGPATWQKGRDAVERYLRAVGLGDRLDDDGVAFVNGSGLYDANRLSPALLVGVIRAAATDPESGPDFLASLSIAGRDGTLRKRLKKTAAAKRARGKTGTLNGVDALVGLVTAKDGETYVFAFLVNGSHGPHARIRAALDRLVSAIADGCLGGE